MAVPDVEDAESAEAIDVFAAATSVKTLPESDHSTAASSVPFGARFAVFEETGVDVIAKRFDRFAHDPIRLRAIDRGGGDEF